LFFVPVVYSFMRRKQPNIFEAEAVMEMTPQLQEE
jgi:hypothetical protein